MARCVMFALAVMLAMPATAFDASQWARVAGGAWSPESAILADMELALVPVLNQATKDSGHIKSPAQYFFQYQGRVTWRMRRYVFVSAFCRPARLRRAELEQQFKTIYDGGTCVFRARYFPDTKEISEFEFNGVG